MSSFDPNVFNSAYPIVGVKVYKNGVMELRRKSLLQGKPNEYHNGRKDREIVRFTEKSMARLVATINATDVDFYAMITVTYPHLYPKDGKHIKADLNRFLNLMRRTFPTEFLWFLEFQKRGAPHFHLLTQHRAITPRMRVTVTENWISGIARADWYELAVAGENLKSPDDCQWVSFQRHLVRAYAFTMRSDTIQLLRSKDGAKRYVTKYAVKEYQKKVPEEFQNVGRFWGCSSAVKLRDGVYTETSEKDLREFLEQQEHATAAWDVLPKYLFAVKNI